MKCFKCDSDNKNKAKFCSNCGSKQEQSADESGNVFDNISKDVHNIETWSNMFKAPPNENEWGVKNIIKAIYFIILFLFIAVSWKGIYDGYEYFWIINQINAPSIKWESTGNFYLIIFSYLIIYSGIIYLLIYLWKKTRLINSKNKRYYYIAIIIILSICAYCLITDHRRVSNQCYYDKIGSYDTVINIHCCLDSQGIEHGFLSDEEIMVNEEECPKLYSPQRYTE